MRKAFFVSNSCGRVVVLGRCNQQPVLSDSIGNGKLLTGRSNLTVQILQVDILAKHRKRLDTVFSVCLISDANVATGNIIINREINDQIIALAGKRKIGSKVIQAKNNPTSIRSTPLPAISSMKSLPSFILYR